MKRPDKLLRFFIHFVFILFSLSCLIPLIIVLSTSFSNEIEIIKNGYSLVPLQPTLEAYRYVFKDSDKILNAYFVTIITVVAGTTLGVLFTSLTAYTLSRKDFKHRSKISFYIYFTMLFWGGLVPSYILITQYLKMGDTIWVLFVPTLIMPYYIFIMRRFLSDIPIQIIESVKLDGANEFTIFFRIVAPMAKPAIAAISLLLILNYWNSWWPSLMYIDSEKYVTLQYLLYKIMANVQALSDPSLTQGTITITETLPSTTLRMAICVVAIGPAILIFPFFQRYFVKGLTMGAVKG